MGGRTRGFEGRMAMIGLGLGLAAGCGDDGSSPAGSGSSTSDPASTSTAGADTETTGEVPDTTGVDESGSSGEPLPTVPKSLVIAIDGLRADALGAASTPNLDALIDGSWQPLYTGAYAPDAYCLTDAASYSGPNHWAIMTGAIGEQHGVQGNLDVGSGDGESFPHYLSLLERADDTLNTAYLFTWDTDVEIPCEADFIRDGDDEPNVQRVVQIFEQTLDEADGELGTQWAAGTDPHAVFLFLDDVDHAGHLFGFDPAVPEYIAEIEDIDEQLGRIFDALAARPGFAEEAWQIVVTTDHGGTGLGHGGFSPEELTIPFLVASPDAAQGVLPPGTRDAGTRNFDVTPTVLDHMGVEIPDVLTGHSRAAGAL